MLPIRDRNPTGRTPVVTILLILINVGVFVLWQGGGSLSADTVYLGYTNYTSGAFAPIAFGTLNLNNSSLLSSSGSIFFECLREQHG